MTVNIEVNKNAGENTTSLIRRFTKRVQGSGILPRKRKLRYHKRAASKLLTKKRRIVALQKKAKYDELLKLGKIVEKTSTRS